MSVQPYEKGQIGGSVLETLEESRHYNFYIASKVRPYLGLKNLEIGAGIGTISSIVAKWAKVHLCEASSHNTKLLKKKFSVNSNILGYSDDLFALKRKASFACVYSTNVLEHFPDDEIVIEKSYELLLPGGFFAALVPAGMWLYSEFDASIDHYRRYSRKDIHRIRTKFCIERQMYRRLSYRYLNPIGAIGWFIKMRLLKQKEILLKDALRMDKLIAYIKWLDHLPLFFGQSMLIVMQKN